MPSAKPPPLLAPGQPQLRFTSFAPVGFLNGKNVSSSFAKSDSQSWFARRTTNDPEWDKQREGKRRRLMASEEEVDEAFEREGQLGGKGEKVNVATLCGAPAGGVRQGKSAETSATTTIDPLSRTIIIHPGSRFLRLGLASSLAPVAVPNVIARKQRNFVPPPPSTSTKGKERETPLPPQAFAAPTTAVPEQGPNALTGIAAPAGVKPEEIVAAVVKQEAQAGGASTPSALSGLPPLPSFGAESAPPSATAAADGDVSMAAPASSSSSSASPPPPSTNSLDPLDAKISSLKGDLRARMRVFKLRGQGNGNNQASEFNRGVVGERMGEDFEGVGEVEWTVEEGEVFVGNKAVRIPSPSSRGYTLRSPFSRGGFNTAGYRSAQELLGDIETILTGTIEEELGLSREELKEHSVILLIPDLYDATYVREMTDLLLRTIGFKQLCLQQEALCTTFGAGVSSACVVDIGAATTSITCVEEGLVLPESRMVLDFGGDDITTFLFSLLQRLNFPYKEADLTRWHDWTVIEELKERLVVLSEGDISLNLFDFYVRRPGLSTVKYSLRVYDDCILAPYALFAPRVIDFEQKKVEDAPVLWKPEVDDNIEFGAGGITNAMRNSTKHLSHPGSALPPSAFAAAPSSLAPPGFPPALPSSSSASLAGSPVPPSATNTPNPDDPSSAAFSTLPPSASTSTSAMAPPMVSLPSLPLGGSPAPALSAPAPTGPLDVRYESSKLPLDVAVVESIIAAGPAEERMKKVAANLLIVGGTGGIHNIGFAVESRVSPALAARCPFLPQGHLTYVPSPKEIEPENLAWKGIAALAKLECSNEVWVRREEWEALGMRAVRERGFYWA